MCLSVLPYYTHRKTEQSTFTTTFTHRFLQLIIHLVISFSEENINWSNMRWSSSAPSGLRKYHVCFLFLLKAEDDYNWVFMGKALKYERNILYIRNMHLKWELKWNKRVLRVKNVGPMKNLLIYTQNTEIRDDSWIKKTPPGQICN